MVPTWITTEDSVANLDHADRVTLTKAANGTYWIRLYFGVTVVTVGFFTVTSDAVNAWNGLRRLMSESPGGIFVCQPHAGDWELAIGDVTEESLNGMDTES